MLLCDCDYHLLFLILFSPHPSEMVDGSFAANGFAKPGNLSQYSDSLHTGLSRD
jgi:hypothetical protein